MYPPLAKPCTEFIGNKLSWIFTHNSQINSKLTLLENIVTKKQPAMQRINWITFLFSPYFNL